MLQEPVTLTILHDIPGRVRIHVEREFAIVNWEKICKGMASFETLAKVRLNRTIQTAILRYDPDIYEKEEILMRLCLLFMTIAGLRAVRLVSERSKKQLSHLAFYSGILLLANLLSPLFTRDKAIQRKLNMFASIGTTGAIIEHSYTEVKNQGHFDPEALSLVYLISSFGTDKLLPATLFTWGTTFARHLVQLQQTVGVELKPLPSGTFEDELLNFDLKIEPLYAAGGSMSPLRVIPSIIFNALLGAASQKPNPLVEEMRVFSEKHRNLCKMEGRFPAAVSSEGVSPAKMVEKLGRELRNRSISAMGSPLTDQVE